MLMLSFFCQLNNQISKFFIRPPPKMTVRLIFIAFNHFKEVPLWTIILIFTVR